MAVVNIIVFYLPLFIMIFIIINIITTDNAVIIIIMISLADIITYSSFLLMIFIAISWTWQSFHTSPSQVNHWNPLGKCCDDWFKIMGETFYHKYSFTDKHVETRSEGGKVFTRVFRMGWEYSIMGVLQAVVLGSWRASYLRYQDYIEVFFLPRCSALQCGRL